MSKYQQIRVRVEPVWDKGLAKDLPRLYRLLLPLQPELEDMTPAPPLTDLVHHLVHLSQMRDLAPGVEQALSAHGPAIIQAKEEADAAMGSWKLGQAEKALYKMEDAFAELERELPKD